MEMLVLSFFLALILQLVAVLVVIWIGVNRWLSGLCIFAAVVTGALLSAWSLVIGIPIILGCLLFLIPEARQKFISNKLYTRLAGNMPEISSTEREALESGSNWWERELFMGQPDWEKFAEYEYPILTEEEQYFLDNDVEVLCGMLNEWDINQHKNLPEDAWDYIKKNKFLGLIIPKYYGGLEFSPYAQSRVMSKISSRSSTAAVSCMVPNSLGPSELLIHYGTKIQKNTWLPALAHGTEIPCFALTGVEAGSDASSIPDRGIISYGLYRNKQVLGVRLNFSKRWITLAPVATVVGLAFKLYDPDKLLMKSDADDFIDADLFIDNVVDYGITCALIPTDHDGIRTGERHHPTGSPFMNGNVEGEDVFIPLDFIIGGAKNIGKGWHMLVECLGVGRGISLPALSTAAGEMTYLNVSAFAKVREQFNTSIGKFEGVQEATSCVASNAYMLEALRHFVTCGLNEGGSPAVMTAMAKYYTTETMRESVNHSMDVLGGRGIQQGPRNFLASAYQSLPVPITVEGANILTRSMMVFGQGAMRCHPYLYDELKLLQGNNKGLSRQQFDTIFMSHFCYTLNRGTNAFISGIFGGSRTAPAFSDDFSLPYYRHINRLSASFSFTADFVLSMLSGNLKRQEMVSGRLADIHAHLLIMSAVLQFYANGRNSVTEKVHARMVLEKSLYTIQESFFELFDNLPNIAGVSRPSVWLLKKITFPTGRSFAKPSDKLKTELAHLFLQDGDDNPFREQLKSFVYYSTDAKDPTSKLENAYQTLLAIEPLWIQFKKAEQAGLFGGLTFEDHVVNAVKTDFISTDEAEVLLSYNGIRYDAMLTDLFDAKLQNVRTRKNPHSLDNAMDNVTEYVDSIHLKPPQTPIEVIIHQKKLEQQAKDQQKKRDYHQQLHNDDNTNPSYVSQDVQQQDEPIPDRVPYEPILVNNKEGLEDLDAHLTEINVMQRDLIEPSSIKTNLTDPRVIEESHSFDIDIDSDMNSNTNFDVYFETETDNEIKNQTDSHKASVNDKPIHQSLLERLSIIGNKARDSIESIKIPSKNTVTKDMVSTSVNLPPEPVQQNLFDESINAENIHIEKVTNSSATDDSITINTMMLSSGQQQHDSGLVSGESLTNNIDNGFDSFDKNKKVTPKLTSQSRVAKSKSSTPNVVNVVKGRDELQLNYSDEPEFSMNNTVEPSVKSASITQKSITEKEKHNVQGATTESLTKDNDSQQLAYANIEHTAVEQDTKSDKKILGKIHRNPDHTAFEQMVHEEVSRDKAIEAIKSKQSQRPLDPVDILNMRRQQRNKK